MQRDLASMLQQKSRLAALGLAVSKINHDLRNLLTTAQLFSDRLSSLPDPRVQRFEGSWRGLAWLMAGLDPGRRVKVKVRVGFSPRHKDEFHSAAFAKVTFKH